MALNPAALSKCYDCICTGNCMDQSVLWSGGMHTAPIDPATGSPYTDSAYQLAVPCTDRRTSAHHSLQVWRIKNQRCIASGGAEFSTFTVAGDGTDPGLGDVTYTGPFY